jgi:phosphoribosylformimino-5-aminoimidazole carboxamide ribotide isomerase
MELIKKDEFDFLGIITLSNVKGIEKFVEPLSNGKFLSRNSSYYSSKTCKEASRERKYLNGLLPCKGKKAFVIVERMLNDSCRVYYSAFRKSLQNRTDTKNMKQAKACLDEDVANILNIFHGKTAIKIKHQLPESNLSTEGRQIEADNKKILIDTIESLPKQAFVVCPLIGGILIGPFFKAIQKINYLHVLFGMHDQNSLRLVKNGKVKLERVIPKSEISKIPQNILIFDDNVGTGETLIILRDTFKQFGKKVKVGALEMSWDYYDQIKTNKRIGKLVDYDTIDYPTYKSTRHHSLTDELIAALNKSGDDYIKTLKKRGFYNPFLSDDDLLYFRGKSICERYNIKFKDYSNFESNLILSMDIVNGKIRYLENIPLDEAIRIIFDYPRVDIIDLDRHLGRSANKNIIEKILFVKACRVGGGVKTKRDIEELLNMGAKKVIIGTHASRKLLQDFSKDKILVSLDSEDRITGVKKNISKLIKELENYCEEFQYVCVETDGKAKGGDIKNAIMYSKLTKNKFNCVGGITYKEEMQQLARHGIGCTVGRVILDKYFG